MHNEVLSDTSSKHILKKICINQFLSNTLDFQNPGCSGYVEVIITPPWKSIIILKLKPKRVQKSMIIAIIFNDARFSCPDK